MNIIPKLMAFFAVASYIAVGFFGMRYVVPPGGEGGLEGLGFMLFSSCVIGPLAFGAGQEIVKYNLKKSFKKIDFLVIFFFIAAGIVIILNKKDFFNITIPIVLHIHDLIVSNNTHDRNIIIWAAGWILTIFCSIPATVMFIYGKLVKNEPVWRVWTMIFSLSCIICGVFWAFIDVASWNHTSVSHWVMTGKHVYGPADNLIVSITVAPLVTGLFAAALGWIIYGIIKLLVVLSSKIST